ncbi:hypothetical protein [Mycolicibacterium palauense]|uniref:hypothetical protein n=1 Tax=Mycolicibacterium palauense TaxID=2034511 RepID=UPI000BFEE75D|nr:hypothetical protein [Mycolicibacterium palauense]
MSDDVKVTYPSPGKVGCVGETAGREAAEGFEPPVTIGVDHIKIGDVVLPGHWIARDGVVVSPGFAELTRYGGGLRESSRVTVTFLVGDIDVEAAAVGYVALRQRMAHAISITTALDPIPTDADAIEHEIPEVPEPSFSQPMQALVGETGSGKTHALDAFSRLD